MKFYILCFSFILNFTLTAQTFEFPKIDYDDIQLHKDGDVLFKKEFKKNGIVVMEAHYPYQNSIQGLCYKTNVVSDSVFLLHGETQGEIRFNRSRKTISTKTWKKGNTAITFKNYFSNKQLKESYDAVPKMSPRVESPGCVEYYDLTRIGEYYKFDESGKELIYKNYETGVGRSEESSKTLHTVKTLNKLKKKADAIVIKSYGKQFFKKNIKHNYSRSTGYHFESRSKPRNNGLPNQQLGNEGWFSPSPNRVTYADFSYRIEMDGQYYSDIIVVRVDSTGKVVHAVDKGNSNFVNMTRGLIENNPKQKLLTKKEILELASKEGLNLDDPDLRINLSWVPNSKGDSFGKVNFQILSNKYKKKTYGCSFVFFDEWLADASTGVITKNGETQNGECMEMDYMRRQENGKYGFMTPYKDDPIIPYEYEMLPSRMSLCMIAKKNGKYGCINQKNEVLLNFEYDYIKVVNFSKKRFKNDFIIVKKGDRAGLFDNTGNEILPIEYNKLVKQSENVIAAYKEEQVVLTYNFKTKKKEVQ